MHSEFAHYFASMRLLTQLRWAFAACIVTAAVRLLSAGARLMPEGHPATPYLRARVEANRRTVLPSLSTGLCCWVRRLGRGVLAGAALALIVFAVIGMTRASYHVRHRHEQPWHRIVTP